MEPKTNAPSFTVSLRGYDRMEVDEYLDSLAEALGQVEQAEERVHGLQAHIDRQNARIADLEERIRSDVPKSGSLLGERIAILLRAAEEAGEEALARARADAAEIREKAQQEAAAAEDQARGAIQRGEEQARRAEAAARAEAAEIVAEAESRASTRTRQIEQWAEQVISHTRAEEARMVAEQLEQRRQGEAELQALTEQRDAVAANIAQLREQLGHALGLVATPGGGASPTGATGSASADAGEPPSSSGTPGMPVAGNVPATGEDGADTAASSGDAAVHQPAMVLGDGAEAAGGHTATGPTATGPTAASDPADSHTADSHTADSHTADSHTADSHTADSHTAGGEPAASEGAPAAAATVVMAEPVMDDDDEMPWPAAFRPVDTDGDRSEGDDRDRTGELEVPEPTAGEATAGADGDERDEFDTKFDAWMTSADGPRHFRRL